MANPITGNPDKDELINAANYIKLGPILCYESGRNRLRIGTRDKYVLWDPYGNNDHAMKLLAASRHYVRIDDDCVNVGYPGISGYVSWLTAKIENDTVEALRRAIVGAAAKAFACSYGESPAAAIYKVTRTGP